MNKNKMGKLVASVFIIYHLSASLIIPNQDSYFERNYGILFYPYSSTLGLNTPWQFFSPNPSTNIYFKYEPEFDDPTLGGKVFRWPPDKKTSGMLGANHMRLVYHSRFTTSSHQRKLQFLANYLCRKHTGATSVSLVTIAEEPPSLDKVIIDGRPASQLKQVKKWPAELFDCAEALASSSEAGL